MLPDIVLCSMHCMWLLIIYIPPHILGFSVLGASAHQVRECCRSLVWVTKINNDCGDVVEPRAGLERRD